MTVPLGARLKIVLDICVASCHVHLYILETLHILRWARMHLLFICAKLVIEQKASAGSLASFVIKQKHFGRLFGTICSKSSTGCLRYIFVT